MNTFDPYLIDKYSKGSSEERAKSYLKTLDLLDKEIAKSADLRAKLVEIVVKNDKLQKDYETAVYNHNAAEADLRNARKVIADLHAKLEAANEDIIEYTRISELQLQAAVRATKLYNDKHGTDIGLVDLAKGDEFLLEEIDEYKAKLEAAKREQECALIWKRKYQNLNELYGVSQSALFTTKNERDVARRQVEKLDREKGILVHLIEDGNFIRESLQAQVGMFKSMLEQSQKFFINLIDYNLLPSKEYEKVAHEFAKNIYTVLHVTPAEFLALHQDNLTMDSIQKSLATSPSMQELLKQMENDFLQGNGEPPRGILQSDADKARGYYETI